MPSEKHEISWIKYSDKAQVSWLKEHLERLGFRLNNTPSKLPFEIKNIIIEINKKDPKNGLKKIHGAWRKWKERSSSGTRTFSLKITAEQRGKLNSLTKDSKCNASELIRGFIDQGYHENKILKMRIKEQSEKFLAKEKLMQMEIYQHETTAEIIKTILDGYIREQVIASTASRYSVKSESDLDETQRAEAEEAIRKEIEKYRITLKEKTKDLRGLHSIKSPMERPDKSAKHEKTKASKPTQVDPIDNVKDYIANKIRRIDD